MKLIKKIAKVAFYTFLAIFISFNLVIVLSGRFYMYNAVWNTYLSGKTGPSINDKDVFYTSTVEKADTTFEIALHSKYNTAKIPEDYRAYLEELNTTSFLVFKHDTLIYEEYWDGQNEESVSNSFSMAKSIVGMLIGIAIDEGDIKSLDEPVATYLPEFLEKGREQITIRHLMEMSSGLSWSESGKNPFSDNAESYYGSDLRALVMRQTLINKPGETFIYQSGNTQLLAYVLEAATNRDLTEYADAKIWSKIGAEGDAYWSLDKKDGDEKAFCCFYARARDFGRLGMMLENKGIFNGRTILPRWVYEVMITPEPMNTPEGVVNTRYGLQLWVYNGNANPVYYCRGLKGQYIITIPDEDIVIIRTGHDRKPKFVIPDHLKNDSEYIKANELKIGHNLGLFQFIALGKLLVAQTEN